MKTAWSNMVVLSFFLLTFNVIFGMKKNGTMLLMHGPLTNKKQMLMPHLIERLNINNTQGLWEHKSFHDCRQNGSLQKVVQYKGHFNALADSLKKGENVLVDAFFKSKSDFNTFIGYFSQLTCAKIYMVNLGESGQDTFFDHTINIDDNDVEVLTEKILNLNLQNARALLLSYLYINGNLGTFKPNDFD